MAGRRRAEAALSTQQLTLLLDGVQWEPPRQRNWHRQ